MDLWNFPLHRLCDCKIRARLTQQRLRRDLLPGLVIIAKIMAGSGKCRVLHSVPARVLVSISQREGMVAFAEILVL